MRKNILIIMIACLVLFLVVNIQSEEKIFLPEYLFSELKLVDSGSPHSWTEWYKPQEGKEKLYPGKFYLMLNEEKPIQNVGFGFLKAKYINKEYAEKSICMYTYFSNAMPYPPVKGSFSGKKIGYLNYCQGEGVETAYAIIISTFGYYENEMEFKHEGAKYYPLGFYVVMEDGWVFDVYQCFMDYEPWMERLDPEMLEYLAEKGVEVYYAKKCEIKIEPHKWNLNWSEDNADPEGLINVWIGNIEEGILVEDIDLSTVVMNGKVPVFKNIGFENNENFQGKVLHLQFKKKESFETIFFPQKGDKREICIEGKLKTGEDFIGRTEIEIIGKE